MQFRDASETVLNSLTERQFAQWRQQEGARIVCHRGRYWQQVRPGFYTTVHLMARLAPSEATNPTSLTWGYRTTLSDASGNSNGFIPVHLLTDFASYELPNLPAKQRNDLRRCLRRVRIVELSGPALLREQGWEVVVSSMRRVGASRAPTKQEYESRLESFVNPARRLILAGLVESKLAGYIVCHAVDGVAYLGSAYYLTEMLSTNVSTGLLHELVTICRRSPGIQEIVHGLHAPEDPGLTSYKIKHGFSVKNIPARVEINPVAARLMRWLRPAAYYRLTGAPALSPAWGCIAIGTLNGLMSFPS